MAALAAPGAVLIEFGSGSSTKTELLLAEMRDLHAYVPIDISGAALGEAQARIATRFPASDGAAGAGRFLAPADAPRRHRRAPAPRLLPRLDHRQPRPRAKRSGCSPTCGHPRRWRQLIIGADLKKDVRRLHRRL